jgi:hypothetical protein
MFYDYNKPFNGHPVYIQITAQEGGFAIYNLSVQ